MKERTSVRRIELCTQFFDGDGNEIISIDKIKEVLEEHKQCIKDYAIITHDKCTKKVIAEDKTETIEPIAPHIHIGIRFKDNNPQHLEDIANWFDVPQNYLEKIKGSWNDYLLYLIHANAPDKHQYSADEVIANFDYEAAIDKAKNKVRIEKILQQIIDGEITDVQCQHCLSATNLGNQYVFVTDKALSQLQILRHCYLASDEKSYYLSYKQEESRVGNDKVKVARKKYRGKGEYIEDILK